MIGTRLGHYEITSHLGTGGMGEVYQAADTKLGRNVAVKFLPGGFSHDAERVARFKREARVLASLNHPNIAAIYGSDEIDGRHVLGCQPFGFTSATRPAAFIWRADGREFIFRSGDDVMSVPVQPGVLPGGARAVRLFQARGTTGLAVTHAGDRFLVLEARTAAPPTLTVAVNWSPAGSR